MISQLRRSTIICLLLTLVLAGYYLLLYRPSPEGWDLIRTFLPEKESNCDNLFKGFQFPVEFNEQWDNFITYMNKVLMNHGNLEGHIGDVLPQKILYYKLSKLEFVKNICEIGFNSGHSAFIWLFGSEVNLYSFDIASHGYTPHMANYIKEIFPNRFNITYGDSKHTVPEFTKSNPSLKCDILVVDGGHDYEIAKTDLLNMQKMANRKGNIVLLDDWPCEWGGNLGHAWFDLTEMKLIENIFACTVLTRDRGFSVGRYIF